MKVLVVDVGGTHVKMLVTGQQEHREFVSGPVMTAKQMVSKVLKATRDWRWDFVSVGYPGPFCTAIRLQTRITSVVVWVGYDSVRALRWPVKVVNDAAMQALGSYRGGKMLFLGLGKGLGSALVVNGRRGAYGTGPPSLPRRGLRRIMSGCEAWRSTGRNSGGAM